MHSIPNVCERKCICTKTAHDAELVVLTGGPGAGKSAVLEMAKKKFCQHIAVLPESASIIFSGGFWRLPSLTAKMAAQRAIFHVQREMEDLILNEKQWAMGLCDRGALDGLAYWPCEEEVFWRQVGSGRALELSRYKAVIHLRTPTLAMGYNYQNSLRIESAEEASVIDQRIESVWSQHPRYVQVDSSENFLEKAQMALQLIGEQLPSCCHLPS